MNVNFKIIFNCSTIRSTVDFIVLYVAVIVNSLFIFKKLFIYYFWLCQVFIAMHRLSLLAESRDYSLDVVCRLLIVVASLCQAWALGIQASVVAAWGSVSCGSQALEHRFSSCGSHGHSWPMTCEILPDQTHVSCTVRQILNHWTTRKPMNSLFSSRNYFANFLGFF